MNEKAMAIMPHPIAQPPTYFMENREKAMAAIATSMDKPHRNPKHSNW